MTTTEKRKLEMSTLNQSNEAMEESKQIVLLCSKGEAVVATKKEFNRIINQGNKIISTISKILKNLNLSTFYNL